MAIIYYYFHISSHDYWLILHTIIVSLLVARSFHSFHSHTKKKKKFSTVKFWDCPLPILLCVLGIYIDLELCQFSIPIILYLVLKVEFITFLLKEM